MDRRLTPANGRVAASYLEGQVEASSFVRAVQKIVTAPVVDIMDDPFGARERQLQMGESLSVYEERDGWSFIQADRDGYVGYVKSEALAQREPRTHRVAVRQTHLYKKADFKSQDLAAIGFGAQLRVSAELKRFYELDNGLFVPKSHLRALSRPFSDPATVAQQLFGTPYLWGGNTAFGIDCSGLIQASFLACDLDCPGDSDMQQNLVGNPLSDDVSPERGDLYFWKGHVAMAVDGDTLIHANAYHMAVVYEPIDRAIARIDAQGDGAVTARKRA